MKKQCVPLRFLCATLTIVIIFLSAAVFASASSVDSIVLASSGTPRYVIVCGANANEVELSAAQILADYLYRISGASFETVRDTEPEREREILIGNTNRNESVLALSGTSLGDDGVRIVVNNEKLVLSGGSRRGALYSVYTLLEDYLGCRWFTSTLTVIPENSEPSLPADTDFAYAPCFLARNSYWRFSTTDVNFCVAHKLNTPSHAGIPDALGGTSSELSIWGCHSLGIIVPQSMFEAHPEYFGDDGTGKRDSDMQPCLSNPEVVALGIKYAEDYFAEYPDCTILDISLIDCKNPCKCEACTAFDNAHGGHESASLINYVNTVAAAVSQKYPDRFIETLAYQYAQTPPEGITLHENVIIRLCNILTCFLHDLDDPDCESNVKYSNDMSRWSELTDKIFIWNYSTDFNYYYKLHPSLSNLQNRFRYFREHNVIGIFDQGIGESIVPGELHDLKTYLSVKLLWDPDTDVERHIREFCDAYYGAAGSGVVEFITLFEKYARGWHPMMMDESHIGCYGGGLSTINGTSVNCFNRLTLDSLMKKLNKLDLSEEQAHNLKGFELGWRFFKCCTTTGEFDWLSPLADPEEASKQLYSEMIDFGIKYISESGGVPVGEEYSPNFQTYPYFWLSDLSEQDPAFQFRATVFPAINKVLRFIFPVKAISDFLFN